MLPGNVNEFTIDRHDDRATHVFTLKSVLWNLPDKDCIDILRILLQQSPTSVILVNDLMSPKPGTFEPHVDKAYRRRDVTVMTMHNAKLRTEDEWTILFKEANPKLAVS